MVELRVVEGGETLALGPLLAALSRALDLTEGQAMGHSVLACLIALRIADTIGLSADERRDLHLSMLLKDAGCSSNATRMFEILGGDEVAAKRDAKFCNWCSFLEGARFVLSHAAPHLLLTERMKVLTRITCTPGRLMDRLTAIRCERGADIVRTLGLGERVAETVYSLDEHWNGYGSPAGLKRDAIPLLSRIACLAQTVAVFFVHFGKDKALSVARGRRKSWFDPELVRALLSFENDTYFWEDLRTRPRESLQEQTGETLRRDVSSADLDAICDAFAAIVDAKSPFTADHSKRVAGYAAQIGSRMGLDTTERTTLYRAGLLHDLGKLGVPNLILEKPGKPTGEEWEVIRKHPEWTTRILADLPALSRLREIAAAHHEKLDGSGYWRGLSGERLDKAQRILAVADMWDALTADRPYREGMTPEDALAILKVDAGRSLDPDVIDALQSAPTVLKKAA
jgi:HD-GYP domain-containing protein (c-di-GMP phosphodiesterase class II)